MPISPDFVTEVRIGPPSLELPGGGVGLDALVLVAVAVTGVAHRRGMPPLPGAAFGPSVVSIIGAPGPGVAPRCRGRPGVGTGGIIVAVGAVREMGDDGDKVRSGL